MRLTNLLQSARSPQNPKKVPFVPLMTMRLKDRVSGKSDVKKEGNCLYEMSMVLACLKDNEYENNMCKKQVENFNTCYKKYLKDRFESKRSREEGTLVPGEKNITIKQVRKLLGIRPLP